MPVRAGPGGAPAASVWRRGGVGCNQLDRGRKVMVPHLCAERTGTHFWSFCKKTFVCRQCMDVRVVPRYIQLNCKNYQLKTERQRGRGAAQKTLFALRFLFSQLCSLGKPTRGPRGPAPGVSRRAAHVTSTRSIFTTVASRDPYRSVSRSGYWLESLESDVLLVHRSAAGPVCAPRGGA